MDTGEVTDVKSIVEAIRTHKFTYVTEKELQEGIAQVFQKRNIPFEREKRIGENEVIDFLVAGGIGLEVKTKGSPSDVARQLLAYAACESVKELVLVTGRARLGKLPEELLGKKIHVITLWANFL
jgi:hypothetical protein